jgi:hypothetical protein
MGRQLMQKISQLFPKKYHIIFDSILPGGDNWHDGIKDCMESCPYYSSCKYWGGPSRLCSEDWSSTPQKPMALMVLKHLFDNFDYYNSNDLPYTKKNTQIISEICDILECPFDESHSPTEILSVVKTRIRQAEFKNNLLSLWGGCSLQNCDIDSKYLVASHIVPWSECTDKEKVDEFNGLLLPANYDYLFDRHLITFSEEGEIITIGIESSTFEVLYKTLGIDRASKLSKSSKKMQRFMSKHRNQFDQNTN